MRHLTKPNQAKVADKASTKVGAENSGVKPGTSRATLAAGWAGMPVCMAIQTTHTTKAQPLKNSKVNQSIQALRLRRKVGSANAASVAMAGRETSKARSDKPVNHVVPMVTVANQSGRLKCG